jgi:Domain of unknown function (DUF4296)
MKKLVFIMVALVAVACNNDIAPKPDKLIEEDKMEKILYDMALIQGIKSFKPEVLDANGVDPRTYIYKKYAIDSLTLAQNHTWYASDLEEYEKMQKNVADRLKAEREKLNKADKKKVKKPNAKTTTPTVTPAQQQRARMMERKEDLLRRHKLDSVSR